MEPDRRLGPGNIRGFGPPCNVNRTRRAKRRQKASEKPGGRITAVGTVWVCGRAPGGVGHRKREAIACAREQHPAALFRPTPRRLSIDRRRSCSDQQVEVASSGQDGPLARHPWSRPSGFSRKTERRGSNCPEERVPPRQSAARGTRCSTRRAKRAKRRVRIATRRPWSPTRRARSAARPPRSPTRWA